jgi:hypothetical protein
VQIPINTPIVILASAQAAAAQEAARVACAGDATSPSCTAAKKLADSALQTAIAAAVAAFNDAMKGGAQIPLPPGPPIPFWQQLFNQQQQLDRDLKALQPPPPVSR